MRPYKKISKTEHPLDEIPLEVLAGIGAVVTWWGYLEFQHGVVIREIAGLSKGMGRVLTLGPKLNVLCTMLDTLTDSDHWIKDDGIRLDLQKLAADAQRKSKIRNNYAHGVYSYGGKPGELVRLLMKSSQQKIKPEAEVLTTSMLKKHSDDARALWVRAQDITERIKASRSKHRR